jgi:hypothetical protein
MREQLTGRVDCRSRQDQLENGRVIWLAIDLCVKTVNHVIKGRN